MVKEEQDKEFKPGLRVWLSTVNQLEWGGNFTVQTDRYMVEHSGTIEDGPVPVFAWNLPLCEAGAGHMEDIIPGVSNETVGALSFGRVCDDIRFFVVDPLESLASHADFDRKRMGGK